MEEQEMNDEEMAGIENNQQPQGDDQQPLDHPVDHHFMNDLETLFQNNEELFFETVIRLISHIGFHKFVDSLSDDAKINFKKSFKKFQMKRQVQILTRSNVSKYINSLEIFGN